MANIVSVADKQRMMSSFLEIAVDQTVDIACHFLQAANWRIEDALQLFYVGHEGRAATSSSHVPPVEYTVLLSDHNHSVLEEYLMPFNSHNIMSSTHTSPSTEAGTNSATAVHPLRLVSHTSASLVPTLVPCGFATVVPPVMYFASAEVPPPNLLSGPTLTPLASASTVVRRKRRTRAEMAAATQVSTPCHILSGITPTIARRRRRTHVEMAATAPSSGMDLVCHGSATPATRGRRQTRAELAVANTSRAPALMPPDSGHIATHPREHPLTTPFAPLAMSLGSASRIGPIEEIAPSVPVDVATTSLAATIVPPGSGQIMRRRCGRPIKTQLVAHTTPSGSEPRLIPMGRSGSPMRLVVDTVPLCDTSAVSGSGRILPCRRRRTRIAIRADAHSGAPSGRRKPPVYKGLGANLDGIKDLNV